MIDNYDADVLPTEGWLAAQGYMRTLFGNRIAEAFERGTETLETSMANHVEGQDLQRHAMDGRRMLMASYGAAETIGSPLAIMPEQSTSSTPSSGGARTPATPATSGAEYLLSYIWKSNLKSGICSYQQVKPIVEM